MEQARWQHRALWNGLTYVSGYRALRSFEVDDLHSARLPSDRSRLKVKQCMFCQHQLGPSGHGGLAMPMLRAAATSLYTQLEYARVIWALARSEQLEANVHKARLE